MKRILLLFAFLCTLSGYSQVVPYAFNPIPPSADAQTSSGSPGSFYGASGTMDVSKTASSVFRSFLKFNFSLPADAVVTSAILSLTPSGTENITAISSQLCVDVCNSSWTEGGINHSSNISNNTMFQTITESRLNTTSGKREFELRDFVQAIADGRIPNEGWRIRRTDETTNASTTYFTKESASSSNHPRLTISYYIRSYISAATIVHTSSLTSTDGSISPTIVNGSNTTMTCRWFNSSGTQIGTSQNLTGVGKGWYGLKYYGGTDGDTMYQAFIVGTKCEDVSITFDPGPNYIDDARIHDLIQGSGTTVINFNQANQGAYLYETAQRWTWSNWYNEKALIRFRLWVDPGCQVTSANMTLTGNGHYPLGRTNESEFSLITGKWEEKGVSYSNAPASTATGKINIAAIPSGNNNLTTNIASFFNTWKTNNPDNFGFVFQLQSYTGNTYTRMQFNSSDATTASNRPKVDLTIHAPNNCNFTSFSGLVDRIDAGFATTYNNILKFFFTEEYTIDSGKKIPLKIYNEDNLAIAGIDFNGSAISGLTLLPAINYVTDKNFVSLSLAGVTLTTGKFYTLEFTNTLGEKKFLKFKYTN